MRTVLIKNFDGIKGNKFNIIIYSNAEVLDSEVTTKVDDIEDLIIIKRADLNSKVCKRPALNIKYGFSIGVTVNKIIPIGNYAIVEEDVDNLVIDISKPVE